jgi:dTDP-4-amino-4,6-dideoxygalactose transaminase
LSEIFVPSTGKHLNEAAIVTLSVRSTFDLYFQARQFPRGSEIIMTGINIGDMIKIIEEHGLVPIPIDLDPYTMAPKLSQLKAATTSRTKACLFAYLYGVTYEIEPYVDFLKSKNIEIIEDCA